jgi:hypothetical protein
MLKVILSFSLGNKPYNVECTKEYTTTTHAIKRGKEMVKTITDITNATLKIVDQATNKVMKELSFSKGVWRVIK